MPQREEVVFGAGLAAPAEIVARSLPRDVELAGLALHADLRLRPVAAGDIPGQALGRLGDGFLAGVGLGDGFRGLQDGDQGRFVARLGLTPVFDRRTASWAILGEGKEPADLLRRGLAQLVGQIEPSPDRPGDAGGLQGLSGDMDLIGQIDHVRFPALLEEFLGVGLEFGFHFGGGRLDLDQVKGVARHANHVTTRHQVAHGESRLMEHAIPGLNLGDGAGGGLCGGWGGCAFCGSATLGRGVGAGGRHICGAGALAGEYGGRWRDPCAKGRGFAGAGL